MLKLPDFRSRSVDADLAISSKRCPSVLAASSPRSPRAETCRYIYRSKYLVPPSLPPSSVASSATYFAKMSSYSPPADPSGLPPYNERSLPPGWIREYDPSVSQSNQSGLYRI